MTHIKSKSTPVSRLWQGLMLALGVAVPFAILINLVLLPLDWQDQAVLGAVVFGLAFCLHRWSRHRVVTLTLIMISSFCTLRYGYWRITETIRYSNANAADISYLDLFFVVMLLGAEAYAVAIMLLGYFQSARPLRRRPAPLPENPESWPTVDVFVPTYNEPLEVVRPTVLAAMTMDWPKDRVRVFILDDGRREAFKAFAEECGAGYVTRSDNKHAKAGNINQALQQTDSEYIAIFDCDHIATRSFLQMTMGWFLADERLAMMQAPHHFYSPDPFERNLGIFRKVPNEGNLFYSIVQDGNDFWNATFFCGSCAVLRRTALEEIGGVAVETVTEDAHTALRMQRRGWNTAYLAIPQAAGLATESLAAHVGQRIRWARGMVQILRIENPLLASGLSLPQRLCYFNSVFHFMYAVPRLIFLTAPLVYLLLGRSNVYGYLWAILAYAFPHILLSTMTNSRIQGRCRHSFWNELYETVLAPYILMPTLLALINPRWGKFNVTAKGSLVDQTHLDWRIARPYLFMLLLNVVGIVMGILRAGSAPEIPGVVVANVLWALFNTLLLGGAVAVACESRQRRTAVRIPTRMPIRLVTDGGEDVLGETINLSEGGVSLQLARPCALEMGQQATAVFSLSDGDHRLPVTALAGRERLVRLRFNPLDIEGQKTLTRVIYSRADSWLGWNDSCQADRPLTSLGRIVKVGLRGIGMIPMSLLSTRRTAPPAGIQKPQPVLPVVIIAVLLLLAFAIRGTAAPRVTPGAAVTFRDALDLRALGIKQPPVLRGADGRTTLRFGIPITKVVSEANLVLRFRPAPGLQPVASQVVIQLNGAAVDSVPIVPSGAGAGAPVVAQLALPTDLLTSDNSLSIQLVGQCNGGCDGSSLTTKLELESEIQLAGTLLPLANNLQLLPAPFFDRSVQRTTELPVVFSDQPGRPQLEAAGVVASWFGVHADYRGVRFPVSVGRIPKGNVIVFAAAGSELASRLDLNTTYPAVSMRDNPADPYGKILAISGQDEAGILTAARGLVLAKQPMSESTAVIGSVVLPAVREPYDAPKWLPSDRLVRLGNQTTSDQLQVYGSGSAHLYFRLSPDLDYGARKTVPLLLNYRYNGVRQEMKGTLRVSINGTYVTARTLPSAGSRDFQQETIALPVSALYSSNTLAVEFVFEQTAGLAAPPEAAILRSSELDLRAIPHFVKMPRLDLFASAGYPFSRRADLSETAIVLPAHPTPEQLALYLDVMGFLGSQTGFPGIRMTLLDDVQAASASSKDLLVLGSPEDQPLFRTWVRQMPLQFAGSQFHFDDYKGRWEIFDTLPWSTLGKERRALAQHLSLENGPNAAIEGFASPLAAGRSVVALATLHPHEVEGLATLLSTAGANGEVFGSVALLNNETVRSFHLEAQPYHVGTLNWNDAIEYWLMRYFWLLPVLVLVCAALLAMLANNWLERKAALRLQWNSR